MYQNRYEKDYNFKRLQHEMNLEEIIKNFKVIEEVKKEHIKDLELNRRDPRVALYLMQPDDKIEAVESQDKELLDGVDKEYKKMKHELLKERIELGHHRLEFRQRYLSSTNEEIQEFEGLIVVLGYVVPIICTFNLSTVKFSILVDKHNLKRINNEYKINKEF